MKTKLTESLNSLIGRRVFVYRNLHKKCWSIRDVKTRLVVGHSNHVRLQGCVFKVSEAGRQRVLKEKRKNVHAGIEGVIVGFFGDGFVDLADKVSYNPYKAPSFMFQDQAIKAAEMVTFHPAGVFVSQPGEEKVAKKA